MHCKEVQAVLIEYLDQSLDAGVAAVVARHLEDCTACQREAAEMRELLVAMKNTPLEMPTNALRENFNTLLQSELNMVTMTNLLEDEDPENAQSKSRQRGGQDSQEQGKLRSLSAGGLGSISAGNLGGILWKAAAAVILLVGGAWLGAAYQANKDKGPNEIVNLQKEVKEMKQVLLFSLIDDESASQRIKAVSYAEEMTNPDQAVIDALMNTLNNDKNANVRLASLYSLARWADNRTVRDSLVVSLGRQTEPIVQIVLINLLAEKRERRAIDPMKAILSNGKALKEVKEAAQRGLKVL
ncbi:MAG: zf-HC2 domain-containing protein [Bacteroidetes bacterium]|nr:zf-HC2 domain-containing protein [Bacteroidota bacterium]